MHEDSTTASSSMWTNKMHNDDDIALDHNHNVTCDHMTQSSMSSGATIIDKEEHSCPKN